MHEIATAFRDAQYYREYFLSWRIIMQQLKSTAAYEKIAATQRENDLAPDTQKGYLSKMKVMTIILNGTDLRHEFLELDESGNALRYFGRAAKVLQLKMPLSVRAGCESQY
jgi:hypothetical protein